MWPTIIRIFREVARDVYSLPPLETVNYPLFQNEILIVFISERKFIVTPDEARQRGPLWNVPARTEATTKLLS